MKSDRLLSIILILTEKKMISAPTLAEMLEVSIRTIYRDVETLSMAGIPIYTTTGKNGGIGILDSYKIDKQLLDLNDVTSLLTGLNSIQEILPEKSLDTVSRKIDSLLEEGKKEEIKKRIQQLKIVYSANLKSVKILEQIQLAIQNHKVLEIVYKDRLNKITRRNMEPYRILIKGNEWYVQGFCLSKNDYRTFKLNRISNFKIMDISFTPREFPLEQLDEFQFCDNDICIATLRVTDLSVDRFISLYGEECIIERSKEYNIIQVPIPLNDWGVNHILSFGEDCLCLEPDKLRKIIKLKLTKILSNY